MSRQNIGYNGYAKPPSWFWTIVALMFFPPLGLYLLWRRSQLDIGAGLGASSLMRVIGVLCILSSLVILVDGEELISAIIAFGTGIFLTKLGVKMKKEAMGTRQYIGLIINQRISSIDELARATNKKYEVVCSELDKMCSKGFLPGAVINHSLRRIVLPGQQAPVYRENAGYQGMGTGASGQGNTRGGTPNQGGRRQNAAPRGTIPRTKAVTCKNCGGTNTVVEGRSRKCEYCGSPIS